MVSVIFVSTDTLYLFLLFWDGTDLEWRQKLFGQGQGQIGLMGEHAVAGPGE